MTYRPVNALAVQPSGRNGELSMTGTTLTIREVRPCTAIPMMMGQMVELGMSHWRNPDDEYVVLV